METAITNDIWNEFVNNGNVPLYNLVHIGKKIMLGETLTDKETSIYQVHAKEIESILKKFQLLDKYC